MHKGVLGWQHLHHQPQLGELLLALIGRRLGVAGVEVQGGFRLALRVVLVVVRG